MKIVGISGSLRLDSTNTKLLRAAVENSSEEEFDFFLTDLIGQLPLFSPDLDPSDLPIVDEWSTLIRDSDGIVISTPEYARGYPGALKNAFDWLVQGDGFVDKPFMFLKASKRTDQSHSSLKVVLETMSGVHIFKADGLVPLLGTNFTKEEIQENSEFADIIRRSMNLFEQEIRALEIT
ncbi:MAG: chromate reductase [Limisphaerales bacterium]|jgi:chromate reductase